MAIPVVRTRVHTWFSVHISNAYVRTICIIIILCHNFLIGKGTHVTDTFTYQYVPLVPVPVCVVRCYVTTCASVACGIECSVSHNFPIGKEHTSYHGSTHHELLNHVCFGTAASWERERMPGNTHLPHRSCPRPLPQQPTYVRAS